MPVPKPRKGEEQDKFMERCMHELSTPEATDRPQKQKIAICMSAWREEHPGAAKPKSEREQFSEIIDGIAAILSKYYDRAA